MATKRFDSGTEIIPAELEMFYFLLKFSLSSMCSRPALYNASREGHHT